MSKPLTTIYFLVVLQLIVRWLALGHGSMVFLWWVNLLVLYFFFSKIKTWIDTQTTYFFRSGLHLTPEQYTLLRTGVIYLFKHYVFVLSIVYLLVSGVDYLFANILFLNMRWWLFVLVVSLLVISKDIIVWDIRLWKRKLLPSDGVFVMCCVIGVCLLLNFQILPFYVSYFYSIGIARRCWIVLMLLLKFTTWRKIFSNDIFLIWFLLTVVFFVVRLWNMFPGIKQSITHQEIVTQTGYIYVDCPIDAISQFK